MFDINVRMKTHVHKEKKVQVFDPAHTRIDTGKQTYTFNLFVFACCSISIDYVIRKF